MDENRHDDSGHPAARDTPAGLDRATGVDDVTPRHEYGDDHEVNHRAAGGGYVEMAVDTVTGNEWGTYAQDDPEDAVVNAIEAHPERAVPTTFIVTDTATGVETEVQITRALAERVDTEDGSEGGNEPSDAPSTESSDEAHSGSERTLDMFEIERHNDVLGGFRARSGKEALRMFIDDFDDHQGFIYRVENTDTADYPTHVFRIEDDGPRIVDVEDDGDVPDNADDIIEANTSGDGTPLDAPLTEEEEQTLDNYAAALGGEEGSTVTVTLSSEVEVPVGHDPETFIRGFLDGISTDSPITVIDHETHGVSERTTEPAEEPDGSESQDVPTPEIQDLVHWNDGTSERVGYVQSVGDREVVVEDKYTEAESTVSLVDIDEVETPEDKEVPDHDVFGNGDDEDDDESEGLGELFG